MMIVVLLGSAWASAASAVELGISDSDAPTVAEPHWDGLNVRRARVVVPYDVATTRAGEGVERRERFETFRQNAAAKGVGLFVVFSASVDVLAPVSGQAVAPSAEQFATAFAAFRRRYPDVRTIAPWNEPNNPDARRYPLAADPWLAAQYWLTARAICPSECLLVAGEFAGIGGDDAYLDAYLAALGGAQPAVFGIHAHTDVNAFQAGGADSARVTRYYLGKLQGTWATSRVWIDEVGARLRSPRGVVWGDASQAQAVQFLLGLGTLDPRIDAIYYYNYSNQCAMPSRCAVQDRGLVSPRPFDGQPPGYDAADRPRAAYSVFANRGPVIAPAELVPPLVTIDTPAQSAAVATATPTFGGQAATGGRAATEVTVQILTGAGSTEGGAPLQTLTAPVLGGRWSVASAPLPDGVYTARAAQAGNPSSSGLSGDTVFVVDTVAPTATVASGLPAVTGARRARLSLAASEPGARFACAVDGGELKPCAASFAVRVRSLGRHAVAIRAIDAAGNVQPRPTRWNWRVAALATALAPRRAALTAVFASGLPLTAACAAGPCRVTARLYAPRTTAIALGLSRRAVSRRDPARPRTGSWITVAGSSLARSNGGATLVLRPRVLGGDGGAPATRDTLQLRLGVTLRGTGAKQAIMRERVTLTRDGGLRALAARGLPVTVACSYACRAQTRLWAPATLARAVRAPGRTIRGGRATGLPQGDPYVALASRSATRASGGASDVALLPRVGVRTRLSRRALAGLRVTSRVVADGSSARALSWPLLLPR